MIKSIQMHDDPVEECNMSCKRVGLAVKGVQNLIRLEEVMLFAWRWNNWM